MNEWRMHESKNIHHFDNVVFVQKSNVCACNARVRIYAGLGQWVGVYVGIVVCLYKCQCSSTAFATYMEKIHVQYLKYTLNTIFILNRR